jgi:ATP-binding cassette subfamily B protein
MRDRTTIVIAHRPATIALADRVVLLEGGRIVESGTHAELLQTSPAYRDVLAAAMAAEHEDDDPDEDEEVSDALHVGS